MVSINRKKASLYLYKNLPQELCHKCYIFVKRLLKIEYLSISAILCEQPP